MYTAGQEVADASWVPFDPYLELFNQEKNSARKSLMHSGFGLGMGRMIRFLLGATEVFVF